MTLTIDHIESPHLPPNPGFSQAVVVHGAGRTIYVGGQNALGPTGVIGSDLATQADTALANLKAVLGEAGAGLENIVSWSILIVAGQSIEEGFAAFQKAWADRGPAPAITVAVVAGLAHPDFLCEISAVAVVSAGGVTARTAAPSKPKSSKAKSKQ